MTGTSEQGPILVTVCLNSGSYLDPQVGQAVLFQRDYCRWHCAVSPPLTSLSRSRNSGNLLFCFGIIHSSSWKKPTSEDNHNSLLILHIRKLRPLEEEVVFFRNQVIGRSPGSQTGIGHAGILPH